MVYHNEFLSLEFQYSRGITRDITSHDNFYDLFIDREVGNKYQVGNMALNLQNFNVSKLTIILFKKKFIFRNSK